MCTHSDRLVATAARASNGKWLSSMCVCVMEILAYTVGPKALINYSASLAGHTAQHNQMTCLKQSAQISATLVILCIRFNNIYKNTQVVFKDKEEASVCHLNVSTV